MMLDTALTGAGYLRRGWSTIQTPGIRAFALLPLAINLIVFGSFVWGIFASADAVALWLQGISGDEAWPSWVEPVLGTLVVVVVILVWLSAAALIVAIIATLFSTLAGILAAPFNGVLAERVERLMRPTAFPSFGISQILLRALKREFQKFTYWLPRALGLGIVTFALSWVPLVNLLVAPLWFLFGAWWMAVQYIDLPVDNAGLELDMTLESVRRHRALSIGFGSAVMLMTFIPVLNLVLVPCAVAGAVALWVEKMDDQTGTAVA